MKYIGIDLGTTNSAISCYDGVNVQVFKSPEQHDVTPSAIYYDKRGNKYVGSRAYNNASRNPDNAAILFKRFMGTNTKIKLPIINKELTPQECSAEVLKALYGYLPEEIRNEGDTGTVITVPAAFNQMQKDATLEAAQLAGIGKVALMQEPVAAVMSVMKSRNTNGIFLIYDLGGGTFDVAIAQSISGKVDLISHGGIAMCGGRDFDRALIENICKPWLLQNFNLPIDFVTNPQYKSLIRMVAWAAEKAKIELSARKEAIISLPETELNLRDLDGEEIYIDISISRQDYNPLIREKIEASIEATRNALEHANLTPNDIEKIVFVGGPTQYKPLRDMVSSELAIPASMDVNPMTAVSEGAALFAESIDWNSQKRGRKKSTGSIKTGILDISFDYMARTTDSKAKVVVKTTQQLNDYELQIDNMETGWTSGKITLMHGTNLYLPLANRGENHFKIFVFDETDKNITLENDKIIISRTAASVSAIPASSSIGVAVKSHSINKLDYWVKKGDHLPAKGQKIYRATQSIKAKSSDSLNFNLYEGEIIEPVADNKFIGTFSIKGSDFDEGIIPAGSDLIVNYEMLDSGNIIIEVDVPSIGNSFKSGRNFYSKDSAQIDYSDANERINELTDNMISNIDELEEKISDDRLNTARNKLNQAKKACQSNADPELSKQAEDLLQEVKELLSKTKKDHKKIVRQITLDEKIEHFENFRELASTIEQNKVENLKRSAQRAIDNNSNDFESYINEIQEICNDILFRQDETFIHIFNHLANSPHYFNNKNEFNSLVAQGHHAKSQNDIDKLKTTIAKMYEISNMPSHDMEEMVVNISRG